MIHFVLCGSCYFFSLKVNWGEAGPFIGLELICVAPRDTRFNSSEATHNRSYINSHTLKKKKKENPHCTEDASQRLRSCHSLPYRDNNIVLFSLPPFSFPSPNPCLSWFTFDCSDTISISSPSSPQFNSVWTPVTISQHFFLSFTLLGSPSLPLNPFQALSEQQMVTSSLPQMEG